MTAKKTAAATPVKPEPEDVTLFEEDDDPQAHIGDEVKD